MPLDLADITPGQSRDVHGLDQVTWGHQGQLNFVSPFLGGENGAGFGVGEVHAAARRTVAKDAGHVAGQGC